MKKVKHFILKHISQPEIVADALELFDYAVILKISNPQHSRYLANQYAHNLLSIPETIRHKSASFETFLQSQQITVPDNMEAGQRVRFDFSPSEKHNPGPINNTLEVSCELLRAENDHQALFITFRTKIYSWSENYGNQKLPSDKPENQIKAANRFFALLQNMPDMLFVVNKDGIFTDFFVPQGQPLALDRDKIIGSGLFDIFPPKEAQRHLDIYQKAIKNQQTEFFEYSLPVNGEIQISEARICPIDENEVLCIIRDVTHEKKQQLQFQQTREKLTTILNNSHQSFVLVAQDYTIIAFNKIAQNNARLMLRKPLEENTSILNCVPSFYIKDFQDDFLKALAGKESYSEKSFTHPNGETRWFGFAYRLVEEAHPKDAFVVINVADITSQKNAEQKLLESEKKYRSLFHTNPLGLAMADLQGNIHEVNHRFMNTLGAKSPQQVLKINLLTNPFLTKAGFSADFRKCIDQNCRVTGMREYHSNWKKNRFLKYYFIPIVNSQNTLEAIQVILEDYTELAQTQHALQKSESRYRNIFENASLGIFQTTLEGEIVEANDAQGRLFGFANKEEYMQCTQNVASLFVDLTARERFIEKLKKHKILYNAEYQARKKDGKVIWISCTARLEKNHASGKYIIEGFNQDITAVKEQHEYQKTIEINKKTTMLKDQFLANMSHEIRTPVTGIIGMTDILYKTRLTHQQTKYLSVIKESSQILLDLINDILDLARIEAGKMEVFPEKISLEHFFNSLYNLFDYRFREKGLNLVFTLSPKLPQIIVTDVRRLRQILINLLGNALKFTHKGFTELTVELQELSHQQVTIKIQVSDSGVGISQEHQQAIFSKFEQLHNSFVRKTTGTGLGLPLTKELVNLLNGEMGLTSQPGKGSNFWFTFQASTDETYETDKKPDSHDDPTNIYFTDTRILVVEDKKTNQMVIKLMLESIGCHIDIANNGLEAVNSYIPGKYDLIFMDITMPVMDGFAALQQLKKRFHKTCPIIALTANILHDFRQEYSNKGFDDFLSKPYTAGQIKSKLRLFLPHKISYSP